MAEADFHYQVTYCDTKYCHRYINFEIEADQQEAFDPLLAQYIEYIKQWESGILLTKTQELAS